MTDRQQVLVFDVCVRLENSTETTIAGPGSPDAPRVAAPAAAVDLIRQALGLSAQIDREIVDTLGPRFISETQLAASPGSVPLCGTTILTRSGIRPISSHYRREIEEMVRTAFESVIGRLCRTRALDGAEWIVGAEIWSASRGLPRDTRPALRAGLRVPRWASAMAVLAAAGLPLLVTDQNLSWVARNAREHIAPTLLELGSLVQREVAAPDSDGKLL